MSIYLNLIKPKNKEKYTMKNIDEKPIKTYLLNIK